MIGNDKTIGEAFHITGDEVLTWNQIYAEIADAVGAKTPEIVKIPTDFICKLAPELTGNLKGDNAHPGVFVVYVLLKIVFGIASGILVLVAACLTCCCVLLPIVTQTALQPLFFFERAWSLFLLRQLGHDLIGPAAK